LRKFVVGGVVATLLIVLGTGLLPPVMARGKLDHVAIAASKAGSAALISSGATAGDAAALHSISASSGIHIVSMGPVPGTSATFAVTVQERIHTFLDRFRILKSWFVVTSTEESTVGQ